MDFKKNVGSNNNTRQNTSEFNNFFKFIFFNDFLRSLALKQWDPNIVTAVGIRVTVKAKFMFERLTR